MQQFYQAVNFSKNIILSMKDMEEGMIKAKEIINNSFNFNRNPKIIELSEFTPYWTSYINGITMPFVKAVVWEDEDDRTWKVKVPAKKVEIFSTKWKSIKTR